MYLKKIRLTNIRCLRDGVELDFSDGARARRWISLVGDNGTGKTTVLRAICLGLCDAAGVYGLLTELWGEIARDPDSPAIIECVVKNRGHTHTLKTTITVSEATDNYTIHQPSRQLRNFPFAQRFICGYGAGREVSGTFEYDEYSVIDAVYTLFNYGQPLQNPELTLRRWAEFDEDKAKEACRWLGEVLMMPGSVKLTKKGIRVQGTPLSSCADGIQAVVTWITDMLAWALLANKRSNNFRGIVLVDELEQHLHPSWQRRIVRRLYQQFKNMQFITTTHSPLCAAAVADIPRNNGYVGRLFKDQSGLVNCEEISPKEGWRYDRILTSEAFDVSDSRNIRTEKLRRELHGLLLLKRKSEKHKRRIRNIRKQLDLRDNGNAG